MDELVPWLRAQLDDDERVAREANPELGAVRSFLELITPEVEADEAHIVRWDPPRVLAEVEAKRRILDLHAESDFPYDPDDGPGDYSWAAKCMTCYGDDPCPTLRLLALPYAGREGYREEWRP
jgi:hypothetical protein